MECDVIINHNSRTARRQSAKVLHALANAGFTVERVHAVTRRYPLPEALRVVKRRQPALLIVGGGDGTVSAVLSRLAGEPIEIGIIPLGTTNNFARSLNLPLDPEGAIDTIKTCNSHPIDLGTINGMFFTNVASIGVSADIARHVSDTSKRRWGRLAYMFAGLSQVWTHRPFVVTVEDAHRDLTITFETHQVIIANGRYHAGKEIAQDAAIDNGQLLVFALGGASKLSLTIHLLDFYFGSRKRIVHSSYFVGRNITIKTKEPRQIEIDGEVKKKTPITASVEQAAIRVRFKR